MANFENVWTLCALSVVLLNETCLVAHFNIKIYIYGHTHYISICI